MADPNNPSNEDLINQLSAGTGTLASRMVDIAASYMLADQAAQMAHLGYIQQVAGMDNLVIFQEEDLGPELGKVTRRDERSPLSVVEMGRFGMAEAFTEFNMTIGSQTSMAKDTDVGVKSQTDVEAGGGWFLAHASIKTSLTADVRHKSSNTRKTDMSASLSGTLSMKRLDAPEGLMAMVDMATEFTNMNNKIRMAVAQAKADSIVNKIKNEEIDLVDVADKQEEAISGSSTAADPSESKTPKVPGNTKKPVGN